MPRKSLRPGTHGEVNVRKDNSGGYFARVLYRDARGNRREILVREKTKGAVRRVFNEKWHGLSQQMHTTGSLEVVTIERLFQEWAEYEDQKIKSLRDRGLPPHIEPHTHHQYKGLVRNHLLPRAANWQLRDITVGKLDRLFLEILNDGSSSAAEKIRSIMSRMFRYAMHQDWIASNLVRDTDPELIRGKKTKPKALKLEEITAAREAAKAWENELNSRKVPMLDIMDLMIGTGCRISEALALHWDDVHLEADEPWVHIRYAAKWRSGEGVVIGPTKGRKETRIVVPKYVADILLRRRINSEHALVFHNRDGRHLHPSYVRKKLKEAMAQGGVDAFADDGGFKSHLFRKTALTAIERTYGLEAAASQAGHSRVAITERSYVEENLQPVNYSSALDSLIQRDRQTSTAETS